VADRKGYYLDDINIVIDDHARCYDDLSPVTVNEQREVIADLERMKKVRPVRNYVYVRPLLEWMSKLVRNMKFSHPAGQWLLSPQIWNQNRAQLPHSQFGLSPPDFQTPVSHFFLVFFPALRGSFVKGVDCPVKHRGSFDLHP